MTPRRGSCSGSHDRDTLYSSCVPSARPNLCRILSTQNCPQWLELKALDDDIEEANAEKGDVEMFLSGKNVVADTLLSSASPRVDLDLSDSKPFSDTYLPNMIQLDGMNSYVSSLFSSPSSQSLSSLRSASLTDNEPSPVGSFAISFDIDGVLIRGSKHCLPHASKVLHFLNKVKIPYIFLTNGGGKTEAGRIENLSQVLRVPLSVDQFVQSHTPVKNYLAKYQHSNVLVLGGVGDACRKVAEDYGFSSVITTADIVAASPSIWPFMEIGESTYYPSFARPLPAPIDSSNPGSSLKIEAIFVFSSSRDYGLDLQIITDLLRSKDGVIGTESALNAQGLWQQDGQPKLVFCNPDLYWSTKYKNPRFGQGAFKAALKGIWQAVTGGSVELKYEEMGKPTAMSFEYGQNVLNRYRETLLPGTDTKLSTVYHIGDSTSSDIQGAINFTAADEVDWKGILVETGIYEAGTIPAHVPDAQVPNVKDAVEWILRREGWDPLLLDETVPEMPAVPARILAMKTENDG